MLPGARRNSQSTSPCFRDPLFGSACVGIKLKQDQVVLPVATSSKEDISSVRCFLVRGDKVDCSGQERCTVVHRSPKDEAVSQGFVGIYRVSWGVAKLQTDLVEFHAALWGCCPMQRGCSLAPSPSVTKFQDTSGNLGREPFRCQPCISR